MSDERPPGVLGGLPRTRPHRRSAKRAAAKPRADAKPPSPGNPAGRAKPAPRADTATPVATAVQAAAELAEIGLMASARALRGALSRLPRP
ncbi:MAG: hypothetical protein ACR2MK_02300 [Solirubrobacteraceae bacterium]